MCYNNIADNAPVTYLDETTDDERCMVSYPQKDAFSREQEKKSSSECHRKSNIIGDPGEVLPEKKPIERANEKIANN